MFIIGSGGDPFAFTSGTTIVYRSFSSGTLVDYTYSGGQLITYTGFIGITALITAPLVYKSFSFQI